MKTKQKVSDSVNSQHKTERKFTVQGANREAFAARIELLTDGSGVKNSELARKANISEALVRNWKSAGGSEPARDKIIAFAEAANVNIEWLMTGRGPMKPGERDQSGIGTEFALVPIYNVSISAGAGAFPNKEHAIGNLAFTRHWLRTRGLQPSHLVATNAKGDSMEPSINDGDMLLIDTNQRGLGQDDIYVIRSDDALMVKRLQRGFDNKVLIISDNPRYKEQSIPTQDLDIIGRVVWIGHTL